MQPEPTHANARTIFITPGQLVEGTITAVSVNQEPFHCTIKILPKDPNLISAEGRYSDHEISLGKLRRNLTALKYTIEDVEDIIAGVESLEGRECIFRVDKSGWISWIQRLMPIVPSQPVPAPPRPAPFYKEVFLDREPGAKCIYRMATAQGIIGWAVGPAGKGTTHPHGWVFYLESKDQAIQVRDSRKLST